ncbi:hypothetical protein [Clostridium kluyveri]|uniref:Uncharacterized protein n=1 Tax=Clostridium kluyveri (strain ATCC 8527 / DSM 555 / NBRC 12016 / NCIMB 10680 / K1) TaxID=431943 RepID=A5N2D0_CLOK5|nr:hypothetical protein [Clostridium kluyveri]EDK35276.1 Hypothetical protein CKL_3273 [Clostridium kluyveri DSM 555]
MDKDKINTELDQQIENLAYLKSLADEYLDNEDIKPIEYLNIVAGLYKLKFDLLKIKWKV